MVIAAVVVAGFVVLYGSIGGTSDGGEALGFTPPDIGDRPDLFALEDRVLTSDGCKFGSRDKGTDTEVAFSFECPDVEGGAGDVRLFPPTPNAAELAAKERPNACHERDNGNQYRCDLHDGLVTMHAWAPTLAQARERLMTLANIVADFPTMTTDPEPAPPRGVDIVP